MSAAATKAIQSAKAPLDAVSVWSAPSDAPSAALDEVSSYVSSLVTKAGPADSTPANEYQDAASVKFGQPLEGAEWDTWFDKVVDEPGLLPVSLAADQASVSGTRPLEAARLPTAATQPAVPAASAAAQNSLASSAPAAKRTRATRTSRSATKPGAAAMTPSPASRWAQGWRRRL